jgi:hypothetical protein
MGEATVGGDIELVGPKLDQPNAPFEGQSEASQEDRRVACVAPCDEQQLREPQGGDDWAVRRREVPRIHGLGVEPGERLALEAGRNTAVDGHPTHVQEDATIAVVVVYPDQRPTGLNLDPKLLLKLSEEALLRLLTRFELAPGELPKAPLMDMVGTACHEDLAIGISDGAGHDMDGCPPHGNPAKRPALRSGIRR